jgi:transaldolase
MSTSPTSPTSPALPTSPFPRPGQIADPDPADSAMKRMTETTVTRFFNDSCATQELQYAIERGASGATSNPVICLSVLKAEAERWQPRIAELAAAHPTWHERTLAWTLYQEMGASAADQLLPYFRQNGDTWGRLSVQTDPTLHNDSSAMLTQSIEIAGLAENIQVKMPASAAGIAMVEDATFSGVNLNVTVCFSVAQVLAIAEAIERGLMRREAAGLDTSRMAPVATIMVGRLDDWMKVIAKRDNISIDPGVCDWAGIACAKRAHTIMLERGYRTKLLIAAYRHLGHWSEFVGGDVVLTMPWEWQVRANESGHDPKSRIDHVVNPEIVRELQWRIPDFTRAYEPDGMTHADFDSFGPTRRTLRSFITAWYDFVGLVRDVTVPDPDIRRT